MFDITDFLLKPVLLILEEIKYNLINLSSSFSQILKSTCANREPSSLSEILFGSRFVVLIKSDTDVQQTHLRVFTNRKRSNTDQQPIQQINTRVKCKQFHLCSTKTNVCRPMKAQAARFEPSSVWALLSLCYQLLPWDLFILGPLSFLY